MTRPKAERSMPETHEPVTLGIRPVVLPSDAFVNPVPRLDAR